MFLALLSSLSFNLSYMALRKMKSKQVNSWILVFYIMIVNLFTMPTAFLFSEARSHYMTAYTEVIWLFLFLIGALTVSTLYFTHQTFYYETAARGSAYYNF
jgi:drug/metabolite transporter (DMT)-like permease